MVPTESPTKEEWAIMASKYRYGIDVEEAIKDKLVKFVQTIIYLYKTQDLINNDLQAIFQEQFKGFTVESFKKIYTDMRFKLQKHLFKRGVFVGKYCNKVIIFELLFKVI